MLQLVSSFSDGKISDAPLCWPREERLHGVKLYIFYIIFHTFLKSMLQFKNFQYIFIEHFFLNVCCVKP